MRTDIHSPKNIDPKDYKLITFRYFGPSTIAEELHARGKIILKRHMESTGGKMSDHNHGGSCHVCGAHAHYLAVYYHEKTNTYIETGFDCADKMSIGDSKAFKKFTKEVKDSREFIAGKTKAQATLQKEGLEDCWAIYENPVGEFEERTIRDIVGKLVRYGSISEKQTNFLRNLLTQIPERDAKRKALKEKIAQEKKDAAPCPEGRVTVVGEVVSVKWKDTAYGCTRKMLVRAEEGFTVWGTVPNKVKVPMVIGGEEVIDQIEKGDKITFSAKISPSEDDNKFGFFSRPTKAEILEIGDRDVRED